MKTGNLFKEKQEDLQEKFTTKEGLVEIFIGMAVWGFILVTYNAAIYNAINNYLAGVGIPLLRQYLSYLAFGIISFAISFIISVIIMQVVGQAVKSKGNYFEQGYYPPRKKVRRYNYE